MFVNQKKNSHKHRILHLSKKTTGHNEIGDEGAKWIALLIKENFHLRKLDLRDNRISDEGCKFIAEALKTNHSLTELYLCMIF